MKTFVAKQLAKIARKKLAQFKPKVIAVTGSVGKTSTRQAIAVALGAKYRVRTPYKNYNNEFGLPLAILGEQSPGKNAWEWLKLFVRAKNSSDMPEYLALEYGADRQGDIRYLTTIAKPDVAVITAISPVHVENYPSFEALIEEKASLGDAVDANGLVILNNDDQIVSLMRDRFSAPAQTYGLQSGDVYATDIRMEFPKEESFDEDEVFVITKAVIHVGGETADLELVNCCSTSLVSCSLAACAVAVHCGVSLADAVAALNKELKPVNGRLRPLAGIKGSLILDDSYNAAPASVMAGLDALAQFTPGEEWDRRIAVVGDMAELGQRSEAEHRDVGKKAAQVADLLIAVGPQMRAAVEAAQEAGMDRDKIEWFKDSTDAGRYLDGIIEKGDIVFVKGSQSRRMEKVVRDIMAEPEHADELLVRQEEYWQTH